MYGNNNETHLYYSCTLLVYLGANPLRNEIGNDGSLLTLTVMFVLLLSCIKFLDTKDKSGTMC